MSLVEDPAGEEHINHQRTGSAQKGSVLKRKGISDAGEIIKDGKSTKLTEGAERGTLWDVFTQKE